MKTLNWLTWVSLAVLILVVPACSSEGGGDLLSAIKDRGVLRVATDENYPPQSYKEDGVWKGFDVDVASELAARLGVKVEHLNSDWAEVISGNWADRWHINVGSMTDTTEREQFLNFAKPPYYYTPAVFGASPKAGITSLDDLAGKTICMGAETSYESWFKGSLTIPAERIFKSPPAGATLVSEDTEATCLEGIVAGNRGYDVMIASGSFIQVAVDDGKLKRIEPPVFVEDLCVAVTRSHKLDPTSLIAKLGKIIEQLHQDGKLSQLSQKYFNEDLTHDPME